ncbi:MAG TPA: transglycosylase family protein [Actinomycetota bacterium]|nr:transglycosylase family protein [Actinomycetota bacterium]
MTTSRRTATAAVLAALAVAAGTTGAAAGPVRDLRHELKGVKHALVGLEHDADALEERMRAARARRSEAHARLVATQTLLRLALDGDGGLPLLSHLVTIVRHRARVDELDAHVAALRRDLGRLDARRDALVDELQALVRRIRDVKLESERAPDMPFLVTYSADWEAVSMCESSGRWHIDSTYDGGLQFHPNTWLGFGGGEFARYAWQATKWQQIAIAERVLVVQGPQAWPNCFRALPFHF